MERWKRRAIDLVGGLATYDKQDASVVPFYVQKTRIAPEERRTLRRAIPESVGISSLRLVNMLSELEGESRAKIHSIMVIRSGRVICEASAPGYSSGLWHLSHSMSKTVTGMAIGLLVDDGLLEVSERVTDIFPEERYTDPRFADITVEHLLSMSSGVAFSEVGVVTESDWTRAFFESKLSFVPGERFAYNSMNSYILARIVVKRSGRSLTELVSERIFAPLGIKQYLWEMGPEGVEKGGFGLYLSAESWAKLGLMMLGGGRFGGRRVLSEKMVAEMLVTRGISPEQTGEFNYGYHLWVHRECEEFLFNGMLGQNVWVSPKNDTVVVISAGNNEIFQQSPALFIIRKYLAGELRDDLRLRDFSVLKAACRRFFEGRAAARPLEKKYSLSTFFGLKSATPYCRAWDSVLGEYSMRKNNLSLLPIFVRCMQNNLRSGIETATIYREGERLFMTICGPAAEHRLEIGLYGYAETVLNFAGEPYRVRALGESSYGPDGVVSYRIELIFPELPNNRVIELSHVGDDAVRASFSEIPNEQLVSPLLLSLPMANPKLGFAVQMLERRYGRGFLYSRLEQIFSPSILLARRGSEREEELLAGETEQAELDGSKVRSLLGLISRFLREDPEPEQSDEESESSEGRSALRGVVDRIKRLVKRD